MTRPVLVVTGMAREARVAAAPGVVAIQAGADPLRLRALLESSMQGQCRAVLSFGIAGGLDPRLRPGDVVVAGGIAPQGVRPLALPVLVQRIASILESGGTRVKLGHVAGVDAPVFHPGVKRRLRTETGASAVDMESHVAAAYAAEYRLPFAAIRIVCDPAGRSLPFWAAEALRADGKVDVATVARALLRRPGHLASTFRLALDAAAAFRALERCRKLLGPGLGVPDLGQLLTDPS